MKKLISIALIAVSISFAGCASQTFQDKLALGYAANSEIRNTTATLVRGKVLGSREGQTVQELANNARGALDIAKQTNDNKMLDMAKNILDEIRGFVNFKKGN